MKSKLALQTKRPAGAVRKFTVAHGLRRDFPIVAIGASAGGIEAISELLRGLPTDTGMAFVLILHLDPKHHSILPELLAKETLMPVVQVRDGMQVFPNHVYVIPPNTSMTISGRALRLGPRESSPARMPIDYFMRSLAEDCGNRSVGVILSGNGSDGALGIAEIQAQGGVTFAQDPELAKFNGMPKSAMATGCVDYALPTKIIGRELQRVARRPHVAPVYAAPAQGEEKARLLTADKAGLSAIFQLLHRAKGVDFTHYRQTTILRRIQRRLIVNKIEKLEDYVRFIHTNPEEIKSLYQDLLINVTSFFRAPRVFDVLKLKVFPRLLKNRPPDMPIRVWTPGCATGEETYSLAMVLLEFLADKSPHTQAQLFGTDVSDTSIARARNGLYPENIQGDVSAERLRRFFVKSDGGYRISKSVREICIFAQHNISSDPPFSQMDLICCRNVLIYLDPALQGKVISMFHYALRPVGYLVLGASEGVGAATGLFAIDDRIYRIFSKKTAVRQVTSFSLNRQNERGEYGRTRLPSRRAETAWNAMELQREFDRRLVTQFVPATVFVDQDLEIVHTRGNVARYLKLAPGRASLSLLKMAREGLLLDLRTAILKAKKDDAPVHKQNVQILKEAGENGREGNNSRLVNFEVIPVRSGESSELYFMIVFHEIPAPAVEHKHGARPARLKKVSGAAAEHIHKLRRELGATKEYLNAVIEAQEGMNEELQSANEEILSSNEELQSTNEELETAKEELQSTNEELNTVNDELRHRHAEVTVVNNDLMNVLSGIDMAVVMVGKDLTVRRFTPQAQLILGLIPGDIDRPLGNVTLKIAIPDFESLILQVMRDAQTVERKLSGPAGARYLLRVLPYRTVENKIEGALLTLADLTTSRGQGIAAANMQRAQAQLG